MDFGAGWHFVAFEPNLENIENPDMRETQISQFCRYAKISQPLEAGQFCRYVGIKGFISYFRLNI